MDSRVWLRQALTVLVISQVAFVFALWTLEYLSQPDQQYQVRSVQLVLSEGDEEIVTPLSLAPEPAFVYVDAERRYPDAVFRHDFWLDSTADLGVYLYWTRRVVEYRINGQVLKPELGDELWGTISGFEPYHVGIPERFLNQGQNRLEIKVVGGTRKILPLFALGPISHMSAAHEWGTLFTVDLVYVSIGVMAFVGLLIVFMGRMAQDSARLVALVTLMAVWSFRNACFLGLDSYFPSSVQFEMHYLVTYSFLLAIVLFALSWLYVPKRFRQIPWLIWAVACLLLLAPATGREAFARAFAVETILTVIACVTVIGLFVTRWRAANEVGALERTLLLVCVSTVLVDALDDRYQLALPPPMGLFLTFYVAPLGGLLLALGFAATLARQSVNAQRLSRDLNAELTRRLAAREQALEKAYQDREKLQSQRAVIEERQRLMRDMHDGLSGQLTGLIAMSGNSAIERQQLTEGLRDGLADLRMIVQSLDGAEDNLAEALGPFRARVQQQLASQGIELQWQGFKRANKLYLGPEVTLNLYRFIQETIHNAVRHSGCRQVRVEFAERDGWLHIAVSDDGHGLMDESSDGLGIGLASLRLRAERLQGKLDTQASGDLGGVTQSLSFPL